ncbi:MAG: transposase, partial [Shinella sp.]|nr:transposase [Shinella sp.]
VAINNADAIREENAEADIEAVIPSKSNRREPIPHDKAKYKWRNQIERLFNKLKNWRRVATRYDKTKESYLGFVAIAAVKLWMPFVHERWCARTRENDPRRRDGFLERGRRPRSFQILHWFIPSSFAVETLDVAPRFSGARGGHPLTMVVAF